MSETMDRDEGVLGAVASESRHGWDDGAVIDQVLRLAADHHQALGASLGRTDVGSTLAGLRESPLGRDLALLASRGADPTPASVRAAARRVIEALLRPLAADDYQVPHWFWETEIGRIVARAERAATGPEGWLTPIETARQLGVSRAVVEGWLVDGTLPSIPDQHGRPLVPSTAVERRRRVAVDLRAEPRDVGDVLLAERPSAS
jgi:hypothetical protein